MSRSFFFFILLSLLLPGYAFAQNAAEVPAIDAIFQRYHQFEHFEGAVLVAKKGQVIYKKAFGQANREWDIPNQVDTRFDIASISKQFTALLILQLYEEGKLHPDSTISAYLPAFRSDVGKKVSIHHLLTHTSGIPNYTSLPYVWSDSLINRYASDELIAKFCSGNLEFEPGSRYSYNNTGYFLLSVIAEEVSGRPFDQLIREKILKPLRMPDSGIDDRDEIIKRRAYGYELNDGVFTNARPMYMANLQGAGNMYATVEDLYRWDRALDRQELISPNGHDALMSSYTPPGENWIPPYRHTYGYGVGLTEVSRPDGSKMPMVFHSGHITGFSSFIARFTEDDHLVVMLSNIGKLSTARMNEIAQEVKNLLYEDAESKAGYEPAAQAETADNAGLRNRLFAAAQQGGPEAAVRQYYQLKQDFPYQYRDTESELVLLAEDLRNSNMDAAALQILWLNARVNPNWRTFYQLAESLSAAQQSDSAATFYKKSMRVNPRQSREQKQAFQQSEHILHQLNQ
jgi:CubicO group peptidase (beta-lactamase class C family)